jgi:hypothetical protein
MEAYSRAGPRHKGHLAAQVQAVQHLQGGGARVKPLPKQNDDWDQVHITSLLGRWVAKLVARLLATAALWVRIQKSIKNTKNTKAQQKQKGV